MNKLTTIALLGVISAVAIGQLYFSGTFATPMMTSSLPQSNDGMKILGHVEYTLSDANGNVKSYIQGDNIVVNTGDNCVAARIFDPAGAVTNHGCSNFGSTGYQFIAIGNSTITDEDDLETIGVAATTSTDGEQARRQDGAPTFTPSSTATPAGSVVVIETPTPFTFDANNKTTVKNSALFNATATADANGQTTTVAGKAFAVRTFTGIVTGAGDTLNVKWTITIGADGS